MGVRDKRADDATGDAVVLARQMSAWLASPTFARSQLFLNEHADELISPAARQDLLQRDTVAARSTVGQLLTHQGHLALLDLLLIDRVEAAYDYLKEEHNPGRRAVLLRALPGTGHATIDALARLATEHATSAEDRADALVLELLAKAMSDKYKPGEEPHGIADLSRDAAFEWMTKVGQLKRQFPHCRDALEALTVQTLAQCV